MIPIDSQWGKVITSTIINKLNMKKFYYFLLALAIISNSLIAQTKKAYQLYTGDGVPVDYSEMFTMIEKADLIFFGELHNSAISHWLQLELTKDLYEKKKEDLVLAAEMFETDNQVILDEYLSGLISSGRYEAECRLWPNYKNDYKPLVEFAKEKKLKFVAANVPRRYASLVSKKGFEGLYDLSSIAQSFLPPLPIEYDPELPCYKDMMSMGGEGMPAHVTANLPKAQALKDATMAFFTMKEFVTGKLVLHFNGAYHSQNHEGIIWYINKMVPGLNIQVIHTVTQEDVHLLEEDNKNLGDYILVVDEDVTTTY